jgi:hypothetical protein
MCYICTVVTVGYRADFISFIYCIILIALLSLQRREKVAKVWTVNQKKSGYEIDVSSSLLKA